MMTLIINPLPNPLKTAMVLKFSLSCQMHTTIDLLLPAAAQFKTA